MVSEAIILELRDLAHLIPEAIQITVGGITPTREILVVVEDDSTRQTVITRSGPRDLTSASLPVRLITRQEFEDLRRNPLFTMVFNIRGIDFQMPQGEWMAENLTRISEVLTRAAARTTLITTPRDRETTERQVTGTALEIGLAEEFTSLLDLRAEYARVRISLEGIVDELENPIAISRLTEIGSQLSDLSSRVANLSSQESSRGSRELLDIETSAMTLFETSQT